MLKIAFLALLAMASMASATVTPIDGATPQQTRPNAPFEQQIGVLVTDANGAPVPGANVRFSFPDFVGPSMDADYSTFDCFPDAGWNCRTTTDAHGVALFPGMYASIPFMRPVYVFAELGAISLGSTTLQLDIVGTWDGVPFKSLQDMWWSGAAENGWGMSVIEHGAQLFSVIYAYDAEGKPTWWAMPTGRWTNGFKTTYAGDVYAPRSAPYFAYDATRFAAGAPAGNVSLEFASADAATLRATFGGSSMSKQITRMSDIGSDSTADNHRVADMWWGGDSQSGWGISIVERNGVLFAVWLTYDADGKPTWFVMPGGSWTDSKTYSGSLIRTSGSAWVGTGYDASKLAVAASGTYSLRFDDAHRATFTYSIDGRSGMLSLVRQGF